jgi:LPS-assembly protein
MVLALSMIYPMIVFSVEARVRETIKACVIARQLALDSAVRTQIADCIGWNSPPEYPNACGIYQPLWVMPLRQPRELHIKADAVKLQATGTSELRGNVSVFKSGQQISADTAYIQRDVKTHRVTDITLLGRVHFIESGRLMWAEKLRLHPNTQSGEVEQVLYRFDWEHKKALPAWGRALSVQRLPNQDMVLNNVTYTTCAPHEKAWQIEADEIYLDHEKKTGKAKNALLRVGNWPIAYSPYLSFPTSRERKSGFLLPLVGYTNISGFDIASPYYWNIAPNYDVTIVPHLYTKRGLMLGGEFRYLNELSTGQIMANYLGNDRAFGDFLSQDTAGYPALKALSNNRWSLFARDHTHWNENLAMNINYQQVSDDYYLQDFSTNLALLTENQLLRQGDMSYHMDHWDFYGMLQSYQTLNPINQSPVLPIYQRLPQLAATGYYKDLPLGAEFYLESQFDYFSWPLPRNSSLVNGVHLPEADTLFGMTQISVQPQGPRYHVNPVLTVPLRKPWFYFEPSAQWVGNAYDLRYGGARSSETFHVSLPRYSVNSGLNFERGTQILQHTWMQTLEPRAFYLYVPFQDQSEFPAFDSAYMIFNTDQLFRLNRFSGFDRISDANQLAYALSSRLIDDETGQEKALVTVGQIQYFSQRRVQLCYAVNGQCKDNPMTLGYLSPTASSSPIASHAAYHLNFEWQLSGDYMWNPATHSSNNGDINLHYQPDVNKMIRLSYSYLVNGNIIDVRPFTRLQDTSLNQITLSYGWPLNEKWSTLGAYGYNISKGYDMLGLLGVQYDTCCWAVRLLGGHTFQSLSPISAHPQYNNNMYVQFLLKGLGSAANSDPSNVIQTYLPGYENIFH